MGDEAAGRQREKTRRAVRRAFRDLLLERGYRRVTILDVIARANIGRSTFYENFRTKYDLLTQSLGVPFGALASMVGADALPEVVIPTLRHFRAQQALGRELFLAPTRGLLSRCLAGLIAERLAARQATGITVPVGLVAGMLAEAQLALVEPWALGRVACGEAALAEALFASGAALTGALVRFGVG